MTGPEARRIGLDRALPEFEVPLASWRIDEQPVDIDDLDDLACNTKEKS